MWSMSQPSSGSQTSPRAGFWGLAVSALALFASLPNVYADGAGVLCTMHNYVEDQKNNPSYDNSPPSCGQRYSRLEVGYIMAINGGGGEQCNLCYAVTGQAANGQPAGPTVYILAVDRKGAEGLDIGQTAYQELFPGQNVLDPQKCDFKLVDASYCFNICQGNAEECTEGKSNSLLQTADTSPRVPGLRYRDGTLADKGPGAGATGAGAARVPGSDGGATSSSAAEQPPPATIVSYSSVAPSTGSLVAASTVDSNASPPANPPVSTSAAPAVASSSTSPVLDGPAPVSSVYGSTAYPMTVTSTKSIHRRTRSGTKCTSSTQQSY
ncbi:hypothetical protein CXG81DRAFT_19658 [Caulochytrium protostelioides]|uniref:Expansin-like EG45 domain-containing protein n=1 Tax=Caulochytrium protostelioides TaxID=1555241 RepID=A0A4P9WZJ7_9FUNG|nr:hypothetical protein CAUPRSCDRAFT_10576 [Caulochytrium protostelioides]RKP00381.1 hypothetical protein CXG81DRAFT_19658 [Caulochytrium protostelioides]|eukprot:RKP00381.1 hypothetical protein CXG81DRAFT_19658 [Caulochytrium protostelioides]